MGVMTMTVSTDDRVLDALALNWPKNCTLSSGDTEEVSLASVRDLAQHLHVAEATVRSSVRRLQVANLVNVYNLRDTGRGVRRLYVTTKTENPLLESLADLLLGQ